MNKKVIAKLALREEGGHDTVKKFKTIDEYIKGSVQFPLDKPIPYDLVKKIVAFRVKELQRKGHRNQP